MNDQKKKKGKKVREKQRLVFPQLFLSLIHGYLLDKGKKSLPISCIDAVHLICIRKMATATWIGSDRNIKKEGKQDSKGLYMRKSNVMNRKSNKGRDKSYRTHTHTYIYIQSLSLQCILFLASALYNIKSRPTLTPSMVLCCLQHHFLHT